MNVICFDLDGTLSDPKLGITESGLLSPPSRPSKDRRLSGLIDDRFGLDTCLTLSFCPSPRRRRCGGLRFSPEPAAVARGVPRRRTGLLRKAIPAGNRFPWWRGGTD